MVSGCSVKSGKQKKLFAQGRDIIADSGMVVSAHPQSSRIGAESYREAGMLLMRLLQPNLLWLFVILKPEILVAEDLCLSEKRWKNRVIDYREKAPLRSARDMYLDKAGNVLKV